MAILRKRRNFVGMVFITGALSIITMGCATPTIESNPTMMPHFDKPILSRVVLADATYEKDVIREYDKPFFAKIVRNLRKEIGKTNLMSDLVFERDMPQKGYGVPGKQVYLLRYRATEFRYEDTMNCFMTEHYRTIWMNFEMKIYDVTNAPTVKITTEEYLNVYDTFELKPLRHETYKVEVTSGPIGSNYALGEKGVERDNAMASDLARQLIKNSAQAIQETLTAR